MIFEVNQLTLSEALSSIDKLQSVKDEQIQLDFHNMKKVRCGGMLILISVIDFMRQKGYKFSCKEDENYLKNVFGCTYAGNMGFFDQLGFNVDNKNGIANGSDKYQPITKVTFKELYDIHPDWHEGIVQYSHHLATVMTEGTDIVTSKKIFEYLIREIIRNVFEHTNSKYLWIEGQQRPKTKEIEIAIVDNGEGITQCLKVNKKIEKDVINDAIALKYAINPGISSYDEDEQKKQTDGEWGNSGYGLYITSEILKEIGNFYLISGNSELVIENKNEKIISADKEKKKINYHGTAVILEINLDKLSKLDNNIIEEMAKKGEKIAAKDKYAIKSASKSSRLCN